LTSPAKMMHVVLPSQKGVELLLQKNSIVDQMN
jgi:hypothetical protein